MKLLLSILLILLGLEVSAQSSLDTLRLVLSKKKQLDLGFVTGAEFSPNDRFFLIGHDIENNSIFTIFDVLSGKEIYKINRGINSYYTKPEFHFLNNEEIYSRDGLQNTIVVWNVYKKTKKVLYKNVIASGNGVAIVENKDKIQVIDIKSGSKINEYKIPSEWLGGGDEKNKRNKDELVRFIIGRNPFLLGCGFRNWNKLSLHPSIDIFEVRNYLNGETYRIDEKYTKYFHLNQANSAGDLIARDLTTNTQIISLKNSDVNYTVKGSFVNFTPDGNYVITYEDEEYFKIYDSYTGKLVSSLNYPMENYSKGSSIFHISDKNEVWLIDGDTNVVSWQINNSENIKRFKIPRSKNKTWVARLNKNWSDFFVGTSGKYFCRVNEDATIDFFNQTDGKLISNSNYNVLQNDYIVKGNSNVFIQNYNSINFFPYQRPNINYSINEHLYGISAIDISKSEKIIASLSVNIFSDSVGGDALVISNLSRRDKVIGDTIRKYLLKPDDSYTSVGITHDDRFVIYCELKKLIIRSLADGNVIHREKIPFSTNQVFIMHPTQNILFLVAEKSILVFNIDSRRFVEKIKIAHEINFCKLNNLGTKLLLHVQSKENIYMVYDLVNGKIKVNSNHTNYIKYLGFSDKGDKIVSVDEQNELFICDSDSLEVLSHIPGLYLPNISHIDFNPRNENYFLCASDEVKYSDYILEDFWSIEDHVNDILADSYYIDNGEAIISRSFDETSLYFLKTDIQKVIYKRIQLEDNNWFVKLPNSPYYMCSKDASKMLHYVTPSLKVIGFDQLDPVYNRPDIVLDSIGKYFGGADQELIASYREAWEKRIDRLGLDKDMLATGEIAVPDAEIMNEVEYNNTSGEVNLEIKATDPKYELRRFNVLVNEVPVYGSKGISISHLHTKDWDTTLTVPLTVGENKLQVVVMNELGLQNFKYPEYVNYTNNDVVSKTVYIGIGVNEFEDPKANDLKYCVQDVKDLGEMFYNMGNTDTLLLTDAQVTKENIQSLKKYLLQNTNVHDRVIISCSSHGLLDGKKQFYLAMHNTNFSDPSLNGLPYAELERLLDSIPARKKLLMIDACNSGENEILENEEEILARTEGQDNEARGTPIESLVEEQKSTFETMMELFVNVQNESGTAVITAAGGKQYALEAIEVDGKAIRNGAFTFSVLEYLNSDNDLTVNGLKKYVENRVEAITKGDQKPTSRQETMEVNWELK